MWVNAGMVPQKGAGITVPMHHNVYTLKHAHMHLFSSVSVGVLDMLDKQHNFMALSGMHLSQRRWREREREVAGTHSHLQLPYNTKIYRICVNGDNLKG